MIELEGVRFITPNGPGDPETNFPPFGLVPVTGARLEIDHPALRSPGLGRIRLGLEWAGLPPVGFSHHYAGYAPVYTVRNDSFRIVVHAPALGWEREGREMPLFQGSAEGPVDPVSWFDLRAEGERAPSPPEAALDLTLAAPAGAFGNTHYAQMVMAASLNAAAAVKPAGGPIGWLRRRLGRRSAPALPNPPWLPIVSKVHLQVWPEEA